MTEIIVKARWIVTGVRDRHTPIIREDAAVLVRDGIIIELGEFSSLTTKAPEADIKDFADHVMLPGFVNSHHHVGLTPLQLGSPDMPLELWFAARLSARPVNLRLDTLFSAFELIASGVTTVQHIQGWVQGGAAGVHGAANLVLRAYRDIGMRASYCYAFREQNRVVYGDDAAFCRTLPDQAAKELAEHFSRLHLPLDEYFQLFDQLREENQNQTLTRVQLSPANLHWCTDESLLALDEKSAAEQIPMHMHLVETAYQKEYARRRTGKTAVRHLHDLGILSPRLTFGHGVWMTEDDIDIVAQSGACICHNCSSNFRLRSGVAPLNSFEKKGISVAIGIDEAGINDDRDMLQEMRLVLNTHRTPGMGDDVPTAGQVLRMATEEGARTTPFGDTIGRLDPGRHFDAVLINWKTATFPYQDPDLPLLTALLQRAKTKSVDTVFINGECVYSDGKFLKLDRDEILRELASSLAMPNTDQEMRKKHLSRAVLTGARHFYRGYLPE